MLASPSRSPADTSFHRPAKQFSNWQRRDIPCHYVSLKPTEGSFVSIQAAIDAAAPFDRVVVAEGEYVESLFVSKSVELCGVGALFTNAVVIRAPRGPAVGAHARVLAQHPRSAHEVENDGDDGCTRAPPEHSQVPALLVAAVEGSAEAGSIRVVVENCAFLPPHSEGPSEGLPRFIRRQADAPFGGALPTPFTCAASEPLVVTIGAKATFTRCHMASLEARGQRCVVDVSQCYFNIAAAVCAVPLSLAPAAFERVAPAIAFRNGSSGSVTHSIVTTGTFAPAVTACVYLGTHTDGGAPVRIHGCRFGYGVASDANDRRTAEVLGVGHGQLLPQYEISNACAQAMSHMTATTNAVAPPLVFISGRCSHEFKENELVGSPHPPLPTTAASDARIPHATRQASAELLNARAASVQQMAMSAVRLIADTTSKKCENSEGKKESGLTGGSRSRLVYCTLVVTGKGASPRIIGENFFLNSDVGIVCHDGSTPVIESAILRSISQCAVLSFDGGAAKMEGVQIGDCRGEGVSLYLSSALCLPSRAAVAHVIRKCDLMQCDGNAVSIRGCRRLVSAPADDRDPESQADGTADEVILQENRFNGCGGSGVEIDMASLNAHAGGVSIAVQENTFTDMNIAGIAIAGTAKPPLMQWMDSVSPRVLIWSNGFEDIEKGFGVLVRGPQSGLRSQHQSQIVQSVASEAAKYFEVEVSTDPRGAVNGVHTFLDSCVRMIRRVVKVRPEVMKAASAAESGEVIIMENRFVSNFVSVKCEDGCKPLIVANTFGHALSAMLVIASGADPFVCANSFSKEGNTASMFDCSPPHHGEAPQSPRTALLVCGGGRGLFVANLLSDLPRTNLCCTDPATRGVFVNNIIDSADIGVHVTNGADPFIKGNTFCFCSVSGALLTEHARSTFRENLFISSVLGIRVDSFADAHFISNTVTWCTSGAIMCAPNARSEFEKCLLINNGNVALHCAGSGCCPVFRAMQIVHVARAVDPQEAPASRPELTSDGDDELYEHEDQGSAILVCRIGAQCENGATPVLVRCVVQGRFACAALFLLTAAAPVLRRCTIWSSTSIGCYATLCSQGHFGQTEFRATDSANSAVVVELGADPCFVQCSFAANSFHCGVEVVRGGWGVFDQCRFIPSGSPAESYSCSHGSVHAEPYKNGAAAALLCAPHPASAVALSLADAESLLRASHSSLVSVLDMLASGDRTRQEPMRLALVARAEQFGELLQHLIYAQEGEALHQDFVVQTLPLRPLVKNCSFEGSHDAPVFGVVVVSVDFLPHPPEPLRGGSASSRDAFPPGLLDSALQLLLYDFTMCSNATADSDAEAVSLDSAVAQRSTFTNNSVSRFQVGLGIFTASNVEVHECTFVENLHGIVVDDAAVYEQLAADPLVGPLRAEALRVASATFPSAASASIVPPLVRQCRVHRSHQCGVVVVAQERFAALGRRPLYVRPSADFEAVEISESVECGVCIGLPWLLRETLYRRQNGRCERHDIQYPNGTERKPEQQELRHCHGVTFSACMVKDSGFFGVAVGYLTDFLIPDDARRAATNKKIKARRVKGDAQRPSSQIFAGVATGSGKGNEQHHLQPEVGSALIRFTKCPFDGEAGAYGIAVIADDCGIDAVSAVHRLGGGVSFENCDVSRHRLSSLFCGSPSNVFCAKSGAIETVRCMCLPGTEDLLPDVASSRPVALFRENGTPRNCADVAQRQRSTLSSRETPSADDASLCGSSTFSRLDSSPCTQCHQESLRHAIAFHSCSFASPAQGPCVEVFSHAECQNAQQKWGAHVCSLLHLNSCIVEGSPGDGLSLSFHCGNSAFGNPAMERCCDDSRADSSWRRVLTIDDCTFRNNCGCGATISCPLSSSPPCFAAECSAVIANSAFYENGRHGIEFSSTYSTAEEGSFQCEVTDSSLSQVIVDIHNCLIHHNALFGVFIAEAFYFRCASVCLRGSSVRDNGGFAQLFCGNLSSNCVLSHNEISVGCAASIPSYEGPSRALRRTPAVSQSYLDLAFPFVGTEASGDVLRHPIHAHLQAACGGSVTCTVPLRFSVVSVASSVILDGNKFHADEVPYCCVLIEQLPSPTFRCPLSMIRNEILGGWCSSVAILPCILHPAFMHAAPKSEDRGQVERFITACGTLEPSIVFGDGNVVHAPGFGVLAFPLTSPRLMGNTFAAVASEERHGQPGQAAIVVGTLPFDTRHPQVLRSAAGCAAASHITYLLQRPRTISNNKIDGAQCGIVAATMSFLEQYTAVSPHPEGLEVLILRKRPNVPVAEYSLLSIIGTFVGILGGTRNALVSSVSTISIAGNSVRNTASCGIVLSTDTDLLSTTAASGACTRIHVECNIVERNRGVGIVITGRCADSEAVKLMKNNISDNAVGGVVIRTLTGSEKFSGQRASGFGLQLVENRIAANGSGRTGGAEVASTCATVGGGIVLVTGSPLIAGNEIIGNASGIVIAEGNMGELHLEHRGFNLAQQQFVPELQGAPTIAGQQRGVSPLALPLEKLSELGVPVILRNQIVDSTDCGVSVGCGRCALIMANEIGGSVSSEGAAEPDAWDIVDGTTVAPAGAPVLREATDLVRTSSFVETTVSPLHRVESRRGGGRHPNQVAPLHRAPLHLAAALASSQFRGRICTGVLVEDGALVSLVGNRIEHCDFGIACGSHIQCRIKRARRAPLQQDPLWLMPTAFASDAWHLPVMTIREGASHSLPEMAADPRIIIADNTFAHLRDAAVNISVVMHESPPTVAPSLVLTMNTISDCDNGITVAFRAAAAPRGASAPNNPRQLSRHNISIAGNLIQHIRSDGVSVALIALDPVPTDEAASTLIECASLDDRSRVPIDVDLSHNFIENCGASGISIVIPRYALKPHVTISDSVIKKSELGIFAMGAPVSHTHEKGSPSAAPPYSHEVTLQDIVVDDCTTGVYLSHGGLSSRDGFRLAAQTAPFLSQPNSHPPRIKASRLMVHGGAWGLVTDGGAASSRPLEAQQHAGDVDGSFQETRIAHCSKGGVLAKDGSVLHLLSSAIACGAQYGVLLQGASTAINIHESTVDDCKAAVTVGPMSTLEIRRSCIIGGEIGVLIHDQSSFRIIKCEMKEQLRSAIQLSTSLSQVTAHVHVVEHNIIETTATTSACEIRGEASFVLPDSNKISTASLGPSGVGEPIPTRTRRRQRDSATVSTREKAIRACAGSVATVAASCSLVANITARHLPFEAVDHEGPEQRGSAPADSQKEAESPKGIVATRPSHRPAALHPNPPSSSRNITTYRQGTNVSRDASVSFDGTPRRGTKVMKKDVLQQMLDAQRDMRMANQRAKMRVQAFTAPEHHRAAKAPEDSADVSRDAGALQQAHCRGRRKERKRSQIRRSAAEEKTARSSRQVGPQQSATERSTSDDLTCRGVARSATTPRSTHSRSLQQDDASKPADRTRTDFSSVVLAPPLEPDGSAFSASETHPPPRERSSRASTPSASPGRPASVLEQLSIELNTIPPPPQVAKNLLRTTQRAVVCSWQQPPSTPNQQMVSSVRPCSTTQIGSVSADVPVERPVIVLLRPSAPPRKPSRRSAQNEQLSMLPRHHHLHIRDLMNDQLPSLPDPVVRPSPVDPAEATARHSLPTLRPSTSPESTSNFLDHELHLCQQRRNTAAVSARCASTFGASLRRGAVWVSQPLYLE